MSVEIYEGIVNLIGQGTWNNGATVLSVLEIGEQSIQKVGISDYLRNYVEPGKECKILVLGGLTNLILAKFVAAVRVDGKLYRAITPFRLLISLLMKAGMYSFLVGGILWVAWAPLGILAGIVFFTYYIKDYLRFVEF